ncbi:MAG TPA: RNA polymerase sigma factor [Cyclobacteriaceae bacterium]|jgi:RNA polymerase sigma-70 factor (ECF subfamily)|nr:RNA polymerase sigma factor [Cyclobacteriaceae bacterium]
MGFQIYRAKENELIDGCLRQNRQAQQQLYQRYSGKMYALCCRYIKDRMEAEDVLVMSFTKIFDRIGQYKGDGSFEGWIRRVVVNESLTYLRKHKNMYLETDIEDAAYEPDYQRLENELEANDLMKLIESLPVGYRTVFNMYAIDGYNHQEIADQLGISENTSKSQLSRARTLLQKKLNELENEVVRKTN